MPDIAILRIALDGPPLAFSAGQYAELSFDGCPARNYSMANHPDDPQLEFHVRHVPGGRTSSHILEKTVPGDRVRLQGPLGTAHLRVRRTGPILAVAGGTGLAPILSILKTAAALRLTQPVRLYLFGRDASGFYREAELAALASTLPDFTYRQIFGRRDERLAEFAASLPDVTGATAYAAGSPALVDAASATLSERGLPPEQIFADAFFTTADQQALPPP
ncbi:FAD-binding oxidoreductase [Boseaceae bacterium BT-24-1]|nr:FAD-binding oxidoreductase [Boseaceae bacterium BT-24-1]